MTEDGLSKQLAKLSHKLSPHLENPHAHALVLLGFTLSQSKTWILAHPEEQLSPAQTQALDALAERLIQGEPLAYLTGIQSFYGLEFAVSPAVLIPRPETELLVEEALGWLKLHPTAKLGMDIGTGSGCIAVSLAVNAPHVHMLAVDRSPQALAQAQANAHKHQLADRIRFSEADLFPSGTQCFDLICANLPYIPSAKLAELNILAYEPHLALDGGPDGLDLIRRCLQASPAHLRTPGLLLLEIEATLGSQCLALARAAFPEGKIDLLQDLAGRDRLLRVIME